MTGAMTTIETIAPPLASPPRWSPPPGACDAHSHVFGPFDRFPPLQPSVYALPDASPDAHTCIRKTIGITRGVLVQPAPYAADPSAMLEAIRQAHGALKGVAVAGADVADATLERWTAGGVVGLRFSEMRAPGGGRYPGSVGFDALHLLAPRMRALGLHAQVWASAATLVEHLPELSRLGVSIVLDHMACPDVERGVDDPLFSRLVELVRDNDIWVKLSVCRVSKEPWPHVDARAFHEAFVEATAIRCVWGSDWPYVRMSPAPDAGHLLDLLHDWTPHALTLQHILIDNPARLYGFPEVTA